MTSFPSPQEGRSTAIVSDSAPSVGACASSQGADSRQHFAEERDGQSRLSDSAREDAISRAAALVEYFHAEYRAFYALWQRYGDFDAKAAYDLAYSNCHTARRLMESLIKGRSPAQVLRMDRAHGTDKPACANEERS